MITPARIPSQIAAQNHTGDALQHVATVPNTVAIASFGVQYCDVRTRFFEVDQVSIAMADNPQPLEPLTTLTIADQPVHIESFSKINVAFKGNDTMNIDYTSAQQGKGLETYYITSAHQLTRITFRRGQKNLCITFTIPHDDA